MKVGDANNWLHVPHVAASLHAVIASGAYKATASGRAAWKGLIAGSSLQPNCNAEGFNVAPLKKWSMVRIGIIGNNENDCGTPDSRLGFGGAGNACGEDAGNTCGNEARCGGDLGNASYKAFGYVFAR